MGSYMMKKTHRTIRNQSDGHDNGVDDVLAFAQVLKCFCPDHLLHFVVLLLLNVAIYAFNFLFNCINLRASFHAMNQGMGNGKWQANGWGIYEKEGKISGYRNGTTQPKSGFLVKYHPWNQIVNRRDPTGLESKVNS